MSILGLIGALAATPASAPPMPSDVPSTHESALAAEQNLEQQWTYCADIDNQFTPDLHISGCTAVIQAGDTIERLGTAHYNRSTAYRQKQDNVRAIADLDQAIRLNPQDADAYTIRGNIHAEMNNFIGAVTDYDEAIRINPQLALAYYNRGLAYASNQDHARAIADFDQSTRINPQHAKSFYGRGNVNFEKGDYVRAIMDYDQAIQLNSQYAKAYNKRGTAQLKLGRTSEGNADLAKARALDPTITD